LYIMQTTYRLKAQEMSIEFLKSLKTLFAGKEVEITIKSVEPTIKKDKKRLLEMVNDSRANAPVISPDIDIRKLIDESQYPEE